MNIKLSKKSTSVRFFCVVLYIVFITLFDAYCYGIVYQQKILNENYRHPVWSWVFLESAPSKDESGMEQVTVPRYRVIQKTLEISGILVILFICGLWPAAGLVVSHYLLTYDLLFYIVLNDTGGFRNFEQAINPYWLQNWYQSGYFILKPFNSLYFYISGFAGLAAAFAFCFVRGKKLRLLNKNG